MTQWQAVSLYLVNTVKCGEMENGIWWLEVAVAEIKSRNNLQITYSESN